MTLRYFYVRLLRSIIAIIIIIIIIYSFFAVHTTSMKNYNHLVSTDNKGYAALQMEQYLNPGTLPGQVHSPYKE